jgi:integrase
LVLQIGTTRLRQRKHLFQNDYGVYYFRYTLPKWYQNIQINDAKTVFLSLKTKDLEVACLRVDQMRLFTQSLLTKIKKQGRVPFMSNSKTINSILRDYRNYIASCNSVEQDEVYYGTAKFEDIIEHLRHRLIYLEKFDLLRFVHKDLDNLDTLYERAEAKEAALEDEDIDAALNGLTNATATIEQHAVLSDDASITLSELSKLYGDNRKSYVSDKTGYQSNNHIQFLIGVVGDIKVSVFGKAEYRTYRNALKERKVIRHDVETNISAVTKNEYLKSCKRLFEYALDNYEFGITNHFDSPTIYFKQSKRDNKKRLPFCADELQRIFSSDLFTKGTYLHPYQYWIPLLALYTGSRANELAQLRTNDIIIKDDVHCISHNTDTDDKNIKTSDPRLVPVHPKLVELGFLEFVELFNKKKYQWEDDKDNHRLFSGLSFSPKGGYVRKLSRWFNGDYNSKLKKGTGFKHRVGISPKKGEMKDFHSFRHTFCTALENAKVTDSISYQMSGHSEGNSRLGGAGRGYRHGASIKTVYVELCKLDYGDALDKVKPFFDLNGEKKCRKKVRSGK